MQIPSVMGSAISIVGGIVLGQAAVQAQLVSPGVIVVIAAASIAALAVPNKDSNFAVWIWQGFITIASAVLGLYGLASGLILLLYSLARLECLGVSYLAPYVNPTKIQLEDSFIRFPLSAINRRPSYLNPKNKERKK